MIQGSVGACFSEEKRIDVFVIAALSYSTLSLTSSIDTVYQYIGMITFFSAPDRIYAVATSSPISSSNLDKLTWLFAGAAPSGETALEGDYIGPRATMITPWSTNAVEITQNMSIDGIERIEQFTRWTEASDFDPMLRQRYSNLAQGIFDIDIDPAPILPVQDIAAYNQSEGLALSTDEVNYLQELSERLGRPLTDSEVFGFSQVNSEHCRHKIFNGTFVVDGEEQSESLFSMIKKTSKKHPNHIVSAYKDNVAFIEGSTVEQFAPEAPDRPSLYHTKSADVVWSMKAETHNFPTTVEPFNGAATGSGGEIRDRLAGGQGSLPLGGTALYMTSYSRVSPNRPWEDAVPARDWLYRTPLDILIKASNGASDFGNKFGQPLINGSLLTFEHEEHGQKTAYDKVIMLAGGIGYGLRHQAQKGQPSPGDAIVILGGDNYRIGMGGAAVSSADTGAMDSGIELNAVQRSNPEMQKRVCNAIRALIESTDNPIVSIHDHGAGGHLNCLSELVEDTGGVIYLDRLPVGDPTLSDKELIGNESQERMGLIIQQDDLPLLQRIAGRELAPMYVVGEVTGDHRFTFVHSVDGRKPMDLALSDIFGSSPMTVLDDKTQPREFAPVLRGADTLIAELYDVLRLEAVACKDWLTNKVDRCVGGRVALQQCVGPLQLPLADCGVSTVDYSTHRGVATSMGHAPIPGLIDAAAGARLAIAEALTNIVFAPLSDNLRSVSLSANWMWPCKNEGEDARLYAACRAVSDFAIALGINVPTGKDSLSMAQKYEDETVLAPGTVVISAVGEVGDVRQIVEPVLQRSGGSVYYIDLSRADLVLGGSSYAQTRNCIGEQAPDVSDASYFASTFDAVQRLVKTGQVVAGHDISAGGLVTALLEMCFAETELGMLVQLSDLVATHGLVTTLFAENPGILVQASDDRSVEDALQKDGVHYIKIGTPMPGHDLRVVAGSETINIDITEARDVWYETSYLLDDHQTADGLAAQRYENYEDQPLRYQFPTAFDGVMPERPAERPLAAVLREKGSNSERELANALYRAGFDVRDVHMTDLISGRETLEDVHFLGAVGGFSNSDVLGSAKGWAGSFLYNEKANKALKQFFAREDTLSVGICNGCQLFLELDLINSDHQHLSKMRHNRSGKHECQFTSVVINDTNAVMLQGMAGATLGVWISHGEGRFDLPMSESDYNIAATYGYSDYPANPNGSTYNVAMLSSPDGRHLATMPHLERSTYPWNWAHYPAGADDEVSPWLQAFVNARDWLVSKK